MAGRDVSSTDREVLSAFANSDKKFLKTVELQKSLEYKTRAGMIQRLKKLAEKGYIDFENSSGYIWWITDEGEAFLESAD